jgi:ubiquinol-cytochrome c reductase cytochrome b subunit
LLILAIVNGFAGYSLPDDLLSGTGLRIAYSVSLAIPIVGTWLTFLVFGGNYPSDAITSRLYIAHVLLVPAAIAILLSAHLAILWRQKHTQFPGRGRTEHNVVGSRLWPTYAARSIGLFAAVLAILCGLGGLAQINPVWLYGPYKPFSVSTAAQPDWYLGWLEGAIRLFPGWRISIFGYPLSELFWPAILLPGLTFGALYMWPFIERRVTGDRQPHHLLDRPRNTPVRTAIGAAVLAFYIVLVFAGSQDIIAQHLSVGIPSVTYTFRALVLILPVLAALLAWRLCHDLSASDRRIETGPEGWPPMLPPAGAERRAERPAGAGQERQAGHAGPAGEEGAPPVPHHRSRWSWVARVAGAGLTGAAAVGAYVAGRRSTSQAKTASR